VPVYKPGGIAGMGSRDEYDTHQSVNEVIKLLCSGTTLERPAIAGNSPVHETHAAFVFVSQVAPGP
jgi:hypothetical protein